MPREVKLPEISENVESGDVVKVLVHKGDRIAAEQPLVELETEKAAFEVPSPAEGTVADIAVKEGDSVKVGQVLLTLEEGGGEETGKKQKSQAPEESGDTGTKETGEKEAGEDNVEAGDEGRRGARESPDRAESTPRSKQEPSAGKQGDHGGPPPPASPSVRREARELGVDIRNVRGSGPGGRIGRDDVREYARKRLQSEGEDAADTERLPDLSRWGSIHRESMSKVRTLTARSMVTSWRTVPQVTHFDKADITDIERFRHRRAEQVSRAGGKLTVTALLVAITARLLRRFPRFNAAVDLGAGEIVYRDYVHIGVAVDTPRGLLVPVVRDAGTKSITEIAVELVELSRKAREKKIMPDELEGGSFTISNVGGLGGTSFTPIVNAPQAAILGVAAAAVEAVYREGSFEPRTMLPLALTFDHRLNDGADAARFVRGIVDALEEPFSMDL